VKLDWRRLWKASGWSTSGRLKAGPVVLRQFGVVALVLGVALLSGCLDASRYPQTAMEPLTEYGAKQQRLWEQILLPAFIVFVAVEGVLVYTIWRYRRRPGHPRPEQIHGNTRLEVMWTIAPALILAYIAVPTVTTIFEIGGEPPSDAMRVQVVGHQWWWEYQYLDFNPPIVTANELRMPVGKNVSLQLESADVIHSYWLPRLGGKRDVVPNHTNHIWFDAPQQPGPPEGYLGQCAEFCGASHANMRARGFVDSQADFDAWVRTQQSAAVAPSPSVAQGADLFKTRGCVGCHQIVGVNATAAQTFASSGLIGPNLTHVGSRTTIAAGTLPNDPQSMAAWLRDPPAVKPGSRMPKLGLNEPDIAALVAYLESLK
jgi:cytochrome c oxidase subunit 2